MRTSLSTLGVVIGVASLVAMLSFGDGIANMLLQQRNPFADARLVTVAPNTTERLDHVPFPVPNPADLQLAHLSSLEAALDGRGTPVLTKQAGARLSPEEAGDERGVYLIATTPGWDEAYGWETVSGRFLSWEDLSDSTMVAVLSSNALPLLGLGSPDAALGETISLSGHRFVVVGVIDDGGFLLGGRVFVPFTLEGVHELDGVLPNLLVRATDPDLVPRITRDLRAWFEGTFPNGPVTIRRADQGLANTLQQIQYVKLAVGAIIGIAILVGGIGIMNVMLSSVLERTREIGIRRAAGARRRDILLQFLSESVMVSAVGSLLGLAIGLGIAAGGTAILRRATEAAVTASVSLATLLLVAGIAVVVGVGFGLYPAMRAADLAPVDAMRHE